MTFHGASPIFTQIADEFRRLIALGVYAEGDSLPSVREVALSEGVNPNTVVHAYSLLVEEGQIISLPKKGYFVAKQSNTSTQLEIALSQLLAEGYRKEDIQKALDQMEESHD